MSIAKNLREELFHEYFGHILKSSKIFKLNFNELFLDQISLHMKEMSIAPNEILFKQNQLDNKIYFITRGEIEVFIEIHDKTKLLVNNLGKGSVLGYESFFGNIPH